MRSSGGCAGFCFDFGVGTGWVGAIDVVASARDAAAEWEENGAPREGCWGTSDCLAADDDCDRLDAVFERRLKMFMDE